MRYCIFEGVNPKLNVKNAKLCQERKNLIEAKIVAENSDHKLP